MTTFKEKTYSLLRKSESLFKTDMVYLAKGGFWLGFGQVAAAGISFASSIFFANYVSKDLYGNYKFIMTAAGILAALSLSGMGSVITQGVARGTEGILKDAVHTSLRWGSIIAVTTIIIAGYYFAHDNLVLAITAIIIGINLPINNAYTLYGNYLSGKKDFRRVTLYGVGAQLLITACVILVTYLTGNILAMVATYFIATTLTTFFAYKHVISIFHINNSKDHTLIPYSKHLSVMNLFGTIASQLDRVLIFHYLGAVDLALYSFSQAIPDQFKGVFKNLFALALPKYAVLSEADMRKSMKKKFGSLMLITAAVVIAYIVSAPYIFELLFPKYLGAVVYTQIYVLGLLTIPGIALFANYFQLKKVTDIMYKLNLISHGATIAITFPLIYKFGIMGAALANGASWFVVLLVHWYYFAKDTPQHAQP